MVEFYYQIKAKAEADEYSMSNWAFPPVFSGMVEAENKKAAKLIIEEDYGRKFPLRVLEKDLAHENFLLKIEEIKPEDERTRGLFIFRECKQCGQRFRVIDLYNDHNEIYKGTDYCGYHCKESHRLENIGDRGDGWGRNSRPIIYQITNSRTGLSYVGKTLQVFTLRWYQHFYHGGTCKFHQAIKDSKAEEWEFKIVETAIAPEGKDKNEYLLERERFWIEKLNTIENGYNTL